MLSTQIAIQQHFVAFSHLVSPGETISAPELANRIEAEYSHNNSRTAEIIAMLYEQESTIFTRPKR